MPTYFGANLPNIPHLTGTPFFLRFSQALNEVCDSHIISPWRPNQCLQVGNQAVFNHDRNLCLRDHS